MKLFRKIRKAYLQATNARLVDDRKTAFISAEPFGRSGQVMVYKKAMLRDVIIGETSIVAGYMVIDTVPDPKNKWDGFVICISEP